jgi:hypothetical protein
MPTRVYEYQRKYVVANPDGSDRIKTYNQRQKKEVKGIRQNSKRSASNRKVKGKDRHLTAEERRAIRSAWNRNKDKKNPINEIKKYLKTTRDLKVKNYQVEEVLKEAGKIPQ